MFFNVKIRIIRKRSNGHVVIVLQLPFSVLAASFASVDTCNLSADNLCKQLVPKSGPTLCGS